MLELAVDGLNDVPLLRIAGADAGEPGTAAIAALFIGIAEGFCGTNATEVGVLGIGILIGIGASFGAVGNVLLFYHLIQLWQR